MPDGSLALAPDVRHNRRQEGYVSPKVERVARAALAQQATDAVGLLTQLCAVTGCYERISVTDPNYKTEINRQVVDCMADLKEELQARPIESDGDMLAMLLLVSEHLRQLIGSKAEQDDMTAYTGLGRVLARLAARNGWDLTAINECDEDPGTRTIAPDYPYSRPNGRMQVFRHAAHGVDDSMVVDLWLNQFTLQQGRISFRIVRTDMKTGVAVEDIVLLPPGKGVQPEFEEMAKLMALAEAPDFPMETLRRELLAHVEKRCISFPGAGKLVPAPTRWIVETSFSGNCPIVAVQQ